MPRPHYPAQGGPRVSAWNPAYARLPHRAALFAPPVYKSDFAPNAPGAARAERPPPASPVPLFPPSAAFTSAAFPIASPPAVGYPARATKTALPEKAAKRDADKTSVKRRYVAWIAACVCAASALFAYLAICRHG